MEFNKNIVPATNFEEAEPTIQEDGEQEEMDKKEQERIVFELAKKYAEKANQYRQRDQKIPADADLAVIAAGLSLPNCVSPNYGDGNDGLYPISQGSRREACGNNRHLIVLQKIADYLVVVSSELFKEYKTVNPDSPKVVMITKDQEAALNKYQEILFTNAKSFDFGETDETEDGILLPSGKRMSQEEIESMFQWDLSGYSDKSGQTWEYELNLYHGATVEDFAYCEYLKKNSVCLREWR